MTSDQFTQPAVIDTNVLVYALYENSEHYLAARNLLSRANNAHVMLYVTPQVLAEFYAVVTNPRRTTEPKEPNVALDAVNTILAMPGISLLPMPLDIVSRWVALIRQYPIIGNAIFDMQLVATMLGNGVSRLYTFNVRDFKRISDLEVLVPISEIHPEKHTCEDE